jgi:hypothetical protein
MAFFLIDHWLGSSRRVWCLVLAVGTRTLSWLDGCERHFMIPEPGLQPNFCVALVELSHKSLSKSVFGAVAAFYKVGGTTDCLHLYSS